ncbi:ef-hand calcium-binding domain-containing protein 11 [Stylonychia lemnae]|uniref:Ef-hand calcium-binding domain-containing protein 11 n=1 Tax=Stylonychia lemnae TaxID=5949 RepID=A0A078ASA2_STYLE|nr:ef-hand calcium-binding domain-containing protein 11 [Stylonychia lemnae]|eukprot:CDW84846.1 ef-hand calcium-binding domain-containing protein 11 [Stylonychia lemnae]
MSLYLQQLTEKKRQQNIDPIEEAWIMIGGKEKGFITIKGYFEQFDRFMPKLADRDVAIELFQEIDSDRDGKLTYKDFYEAMLFEL